MSHIVQIQKEVRDPSAIRAACNRLQLAPPIRDTFQLFSGEVSGLGVELPDWRYPIVCRTESGQVQYDNYGGRWGDRQQLDRFLQAYAVEVTKLEARRKGHSVNNVRREDCGVGWVMGCERRRGVCVELG